MTYVIISGLGFFRFGGGWCKEYPDAHIFTTYTKAHTTAKICLKNYKGKLPIMGDCEQISIVENYGLDLEKPVCMLSVYDG